MRVGSLSIVVSDDPTEDSSITNWALCRHGIQSKRTILIDTLMRSLRVVISDVLGQNATQMALIENNQAIQTLFLDRPHPAFGYSIGRYSKLTKCAGVVLRWPLPVAYIPKYTPVKPPATSVDK